MKDHCKKLEKAAYELKQLCLLETKKGKIRYIENSLNVSYNAQHFIYIIDSPWLTRLLLYPDKPIISQK